MTSKPAIRWRGRFLPLAGVMLAFCLTGEGSEPRPTLPEPAIPFAPLRYLCCRSLGPIRIDGREEDPTWRKAPWTDLFTDIEGPSRPAPRFRTAAKMAWDDKCFYVFARLEEPDVWAAVTRRDAVIFQDNDFEVFIDPDGDTHGYYELEVNALNTVWDLFLERPYRDGGRALNGWDIHGLRSAVAVEGTLNRPGDRDRGWSVEMAIPWAALAEFAPQQKPPSPGDTWRINFSRVEWRTDALGRRYRKRVDPQTGKLLPEENWVWSAQGLVDMHYPEMWGYVTFAPAGKFTPPELGAAEPVKWFLRRIYYRQLAHFSRTSRFATRLDDLGLEEPTLAGWGPVALSVTLDLFQATLAAPDGSLWSIRQDGLVWKSDKK